MPRVLIYGDSNTFGIGPMPVFGADTVHPCEARWGDVAVRALGAGWEVMITELLCPTTVQDRPVEGAFRTGSTVLPAAQQSYKLIDILAICLGTNDLKHRFSSCAQDVALGLARLGREMLARGVVGHVFQVAPPTVKEVGEFAEMFAGAEAPGAELPDHVAPFATEEWATVMEAGSLISVDEMDGIHLSLEAHAALGAALAGAPRGIV